MPDERLPETAGQQPDLEAVLRAVSREAAFPPTPNLWPGVERAIQARTLAERENRRGVQVWTGSVRRMAIAAAILLLILAAAAFAVPGVRHAIADRLGLTGVVIRLFEVPPPALAPVGSALDLGEPVSLAEAVRRADFLVRVPAAPGFGPPQEVYVTYGDANPMVSFVYPATDSLPASRFTGVGALVTQFRGHLRQVLIEKGLRTETAVTRTTVDGAPAFWLDGATHFFLYEADSAEILSEDYRLAGNVLLWERDGVTYRIEAELTMEDAVAIAESMEPAGAAGTD